MWFKQLYLYQLSEETLQNLPDLASLIQNSTFLPTTGLEWFSQGFASPTPFSDELSYEIRGFHLISLKREDKVLPASVIKDFLLRKVAEIESNELRKLGKKEKTELKEQITDDLLPRAFVKHSRTQAYFDAKRGLLMIDCAAASKAEALVSKLREALPPFPAKLIQTEITPSNLMTDWVATGEASHGFSLESECELKDADENGATIRCSKVDLGTDEIRQHIANGKMVTRLGLTWQDKISFVLTDTLQIKRIQFLDVMKEEASQEGEDQASLFAATQLLQCEALGQLVDALITALGGVIPEMKA